MEIIINDLITIIAIIQFILGIILFYKVVKSNIQVIWLLVFDSFLQALIFLVFTGSPFLDFGNIFVFIVGISHLLIVIFVHETFYKGQNRVYILYLVIIIICFIGYFLDLYETFPFTNPISIYIFAWYNFLLSSIPHFWCSYVILKQYFVYRNKDIQPWIKMRYLIAGISHLPWGLLGIYTLFYWYAGNIPLIYASIVYAMAITMFTIGYFIAWVMPEPLKKFFNRHYENIEFKAMTEEEIMQLIERVDNE